MTQAQNYLKLESLLHATQAKDSSYQAALYLLSTDAELTDTAAKYIDSDGIDFTRIKRSTQGFDERTQQLIDVAHNLFSWNSACTVTPFDLSRLGYPMLDQVCKALYISTGQVKVQIQERDTPQPRMELDDSSYQQSIRFAKAIERMQAGMSREPEAEPEL
ncbi:hypothetical protein [Oscillibacter sp.]|uniref:hypothetical protein n=1 Tax=Oscillibacter sp. TaxID=1945593 RepID=UPI002897DF09|nr:hypothetical protein [Oscillibacter sp.]